MKLSIIIPVYNVEAYVGKALESIYDTSVNLDDFEVIVVNDGSEDGSMEVINRYASQPNLTILEQENQGVSAARMNGLVNANGEFVWFVDSDDFLVKNGVSKVLELLVELPNEDVIMFPVRRVSLDGSMDYVDFKPEGFLSVSGKIAINDLKLPTCPPFRFVIRKSLTDNKWLFFPFGLVHEDEYFGPILLTIAQRITVVPDYVYVHLKRPGSIMTTLSIRSSYDTVSVFKLLIDYLENAMAPSDQDWFRRYCLGRLMESYIRCPDLYGTPEFNQFVHTNGLYIWNQWCRTYPEAPLSKKMKRLLFFVLPRLRQRFIRS